MPQNRFWVASYPEYQAAHNAMEALQVLNKTKNYQIRRGQDKNHQETFRVVERMQSSEAEVLNYARNNPSKRVGPGKRRARKLSNPILQ